MLGRGVELVAHHQVHRKPQPAIRRVGLLKRPPRQLDALLLDQRIAGRDALRAEEREAHRAADQERVGGVEEAIDQRDLVGDLRAAEHHHERALGRLDDRAQRDHLVLEQQAGHGRAQILRHPRGGRVRAVSGPEGVVHVGVAERGQLAREDRVVVGLSPFPPGVLEHEHGAGLEPVDASAHLRADYLRRLVDVRVDQLGQPRGHRRERGLRIASLRSAEMRAEHQPDALLQQQLDRRQGGPDARVVRHPPALERHVEIDACEDRLAGRYVQVPDSPLAEHLRRRASPQERAGQGPPLGSSSPTRCRTTRSPSRASRR